MLHQRSGGSQRLGLPGYEWWNEALHGIAAYEFPVAGAHFDGRTPNATSFPQVILTAASFNRSLFRGIGEVVGTEARAFFDEGSGGLTYWSPNVNVYPDPRWGRGQETPGEDAMLAGAYGAEFVRGLQAQRPDGRLRASACCKHFPLNPLEQYRTAKQAASRHSFDAAVPKGELGYYLAPFEACVREGRATGVMCSYGSTNGVPACADEKFLRKLLRERWGFDGYVTSDCEALMDLLPQAHNYSRSVQEAQRAAWAAGVDLECGMRSIFGVGAEVFNLEGVTQNRERVDESLMNLLKVQLRLGMFDPPAKEEMSKHASAVSTAAHRRLALEAALQGSVLLKNQGPGRLPWQSSALRRLAVVGPHASASVALLGNYYGIPPHVISPTTGLAARAGAVSVASGCGTYRLPPGIDYDAVDCTELDRESVRSAARGADAVLVVLGLDQSHAYGGEGSKLHTCGPGQEGEDCDRTTLRLPQGQLDLLQTAKEAAGAAPLAVVLLSGGALDVQDLLKDERVSAVLWMGYPGQEGGEALAQLVYGESNPSGRLPTTWYPESFAESVDFLDVRLHSATGHPGRTYRFYAGEPLLPFGHGLSYTTFNLRILESVPLESNGLVASELAAMAQEVEAGGSYLRQTAPGVARVECEAQNSGDRVGEVVLLLFVSPPGAGTAGRPLRTLAGFARTTVLAPGARERVSFQLTASDLSVVSEGGVHEAIPGTWKLSLADGAADGGASLDLA